MSHKSLSFTVGASLAIAFSVFAFTEPSQAPPGGNVAAPINVSGTAQTKSGDLTVNNLFAKNLSVAPGVSEYNITNVNNVIGFNDLFLKGNSSETAPVYIAGSEIKMYTSNAERLTITSAGNVGIGGLPGTAKLRVISSDLGSGPLDYSIFANYGGSILFNVKNNGRVGIGKDADGNAALDVQSKPGGYGLAVRDSASGSFANISADNGHAYFGYNNPNGASGLTVDSSGGVQIRKGGDVYEGASLGVNNDAGIGIWSECNWGNCIAGANYNGVGAGIKGINIGGGVGVDGHGTGIGDFYASGPAQDYASASSIRWKKNVAPIDSPLEKVLKLQGVYFDWDKEHGGRHDLGLIAEEVGKIIPEIVSFESDGSGYANGLDYSRLSPLLIEAIKEQQKEIEWLKTRINILENGL